MQSWLIKAEGAQHTSLQGPDVQWGDAGRVFADQYCLWSPSQEIQHCEAFRISFGLGLEMGIYLEG